jgi:hypothetical protein
MNSNSVTIANLNTMLVIALYCLVFVHKLLTRSHHHHAVNECWRFHSGKLDCLVRESSEGTVGKFSSVQSRKYVGLTLCMSRIISQCVAVVLGTVTR